MTRKEALDMLMLLSGLEAAGIINRNLPDYLLERLHDAVVVLEREVLGDEK